MHNFIFLKFFFFFYYNISSGLLTGVKLQLLTNVKQMERYVVYESSSLTDRPFNQKKKKGKKRRNTLYTCIIESN